MSSVIYVDNAATTPVDSRVVDAMLPYLHTQWFNPSSFYQPAQDIRRVIESCRRYLASTLDASASEIRFTSGGTESDNAAVKGLALANTAKGKHVIISAVEHPAVRESVTWLARNGFEVSMCPVDSAGRVLPETFGSLLRPDTVLASIMLANNEVGTIQPIQKLAALSHENGTLFHTDAVQAYGHIPVSVEDLGVDALSASAHKIHGPKGCGLLYVRRGVACEPLMHGGAQERGYRAGTENVAGIVGFAAAAHVAFDVPDPSALPSPESPEFCLLDKEFLQSCLSISRDYVNALRMQFVETLEALIPDVSFNGFTAQSPSFRPPCLPGIISLTIPGVSSEAMLMRLDERGICASAGSACASGSLEPSKVLLAMGLSEANAQSTLRFSFSVRNTKEEVEAAATCLAQVATSIRNA